MSSPSTDYVTYARHPTVDGGQELRAKIMRPADADGPLPLWVWFPGGDFETCNIEARHLNRMARTVLGMGYAMAIVEHRVSARADDLTPDAAALLPKLEQEAALRAPALSPGQCGASAVAATEDGAAFLAWAKAQAQAQGFSGHFLVGGTSTGAMTALNLLHLAPAIGLVVPDIATVVSVSGGFAYPGLIQETCETRVLALHGADDTKISPQSIRIYAYLAGPRCALLDCARLRHGEIRVSPAENFRKGIRRMVTFDRGEQIASAKINADGDAVTPAKRRNRICMYTCVRNEGPFLLEWIAHNRAIGVTDFIIFSNDCDDGTAELLDALHTKGIVMHVPNPSTLLDSGQHLKITVDCARYARPFRKSDYAILIDVDEFIQIDVADGTLNGLLAATGYPDAISISELLFGFGGVTQFENRLVTSQFLVSDTMEPSDRSAARRGVKSIMRVSRDVQSYSNHRPIFVPAAVAAGLDWRDGSGNPVPERFIAEHDRGLDVRGRYQLARLNHYTLRSAESMLVKFQRGDAVRQGRMRPAYISDRNAKARSNTAFLGAIPRLKEELSDLLSDPHILGLHRQAVQHHQAKIAALKADPAYAEIWQAIQSEAAQSLPEAPSQAAE